MYRCNNCNAKFEEPTMKRICFEQEYGVANLFDSRHYTNIEVCPSCEDGDIEELEQCERCGNYVSETCESLCDCCYEDIYE